MFKASEAGTAINAIMTRLTSGTGQAAEALDEIGISAFDSSGNFKGMEAVMRELEGALSVMDDETRSHYQTMIAGLNHGKTFNAMLNGLTEEYDELKSGISESDGALKEMRDTMKDNLQGALENLGSAFEEILISIGTALLPVIKLLVGALQSMADWFNNLSGTTKTIIATFLGVAAAVTAIAGPMLLLVGFIPQIVAGFVALKVATMAATGWIAKGTTAMIAKAGAAKLLGVALKVMSGPVGWVIGGVAALTAGVIGVVKWFKRESKETKRLNAETEKLAEETEGLNDAVNDSSEAYKDKQTSTEAEIRNNEELAEKVQKLADKESLSASEKEMLRTYTDQLNESMDGLNLAYDEESGKLNQSSEQIQARIDLLGEQDKANDAMERAKEITEQQVEAEKKLGEVAELRQEWNDKLEDGSVKSREHKKAVEELGEQEKELEGTLKELDAQYVATEEQVEASMNAIAEASKNATESQLLDYASLEDHQRDLVDEMQANWQDLAKASTDIFEKISSDAEVSFAEMQETFDHNVKATEEWASNLETLAEAGVSSAFLDTFREKGPESAALVQELVDADIKEVIKLGDGFEKQTEKALDQMAQAYNLDTKQFEAVRHLVEDVGMTFTEAINSAGFDQYGEDIADGVEEGVYDGTDDVINSVQDMSEGMSDAFRKLNDIHSPSGVYKGFGIDIVDGLSNGVDGNISDAVKVMTALATKLIAEFDGIKASFTSIGKDAMAGLNAGLESSRSSVVSKARNIANTVASTMRSALQVRSPSRVLAEIGRWTGVGLADGIAGTQALVARASEGLAQASIPEISMDYATPNGIQSTLASAINGTVDVNANDSMTAMAIARLGERLDGMQVVMEGEQVGVLVAPTVSREIQTETDGEYRRQGGRRIW